MDIKLSIGTIVGIQLTLIILKIFGTITLSWFNVFMPLIMVVGLYVFALIMTLITILIFFYKKY